jgi:cytochrome c oxidase subunit 4
MASKSLLETHHHVVPIRVYALVLFALFVLMAITVAVGQIALPSVGPLSGTILNQAIALIIAVLKATLVVLFFMGVRWSTKLTRLWAACGFVFVTMFTLIAGDYAARKYEQVQGWDPRQDSALPRKISEPDKFSDKPIRADDDLNVRPRQ